MTKTTLTRQGPIAVLTMDDGKANTVDIPTFQELLARFDEIAASDATGVLVTGRPGYFCAGLDLKRLPTLGADGLAELVRLFGEVMLRVFTFPRPVVAAVNGHAMGAGAILALSADARLVADGPFRFALNEVPIGMTVPTFGVEIARAVVPAHVHADMLMHGRTFSPAELRERFVMEAVLPADALFQAALDRVTPLAGLDGEAYAATKKRVRHASAELGRAVLAVESRELTRKFVV